MERFLLCLTAMYLGPTLSTAAPQRLQGLKQTNEPLNFLSIGSAQGGNHEISPDYINLLDADQWKELLAQGKVRDMIDTIQRALGSQRPVRVRTQLGGPGAQDFGNSVRNTVNWGAYKGDKTRLNLVMDSKFSRHNGKVDMIDPSIGVNFQLKY